MTSEEKPKPIEELLSDSEQHSTDIVQETTKEEFNDVLSLIEQFVELKDRLIEVKDMAPASIKQELEYIIQDYDSLVNIIDSETSPVEIIQTATLSGNLRKSKVERLGIGGELVRLRNEEKITIKELSERFGISDQVISRFFRYYDSLRPSDKSKYNKKSVLEVTERIEELQTIILRNINRLEGLNDAVAVKYTGELRQTLELAMNLAEKINEEKERRREYEEFKQAVYEILVDELPEKQAKILDRIKSVSYEEK